MMMSNLKIFDYTEYNCNEKENIFLEEEKY